MPKRLIDDSYLSSPSLAKCSPRAQDAFPRFILLMDDFGCAEATPRVLLGRGWPLRDDVTERDVWTWLEEYVAAGMACLWTDKERRWVHLTGWFGPHGQRRRAEYDPSAPEGTAGRHGSKRKTPPPPADLVAAVMAGARRDVDGKPPGVDREDEPETIKEITPAREMGGKSAGTDRETTGTRAVPAHAGAGASAVPGAVPVAGAGAPQAAGEPLRPVSVHLQGQCPALADALARTSVPIDVGRRAAAWGEADGIVRQVGTEAVLACWVATHAKRGGESLPLAYAIHPMRDLVKRSPPVVGMAQPAGPEAFTEGEHAFDR